MNTASPHLSAPAGPHVQAVPAGAAPAMSRWGSIDRKSPLLACFLSAMPGLGQVYVGYYRRGFVHAIVVASLITLLSEDVGPLTPMLALFMAFFWLYNVIDAGRRAAYYNHVAAGGETFDMPADFATPGMHGSIAGGLLLIAAGVVFLSYTVWEIPLDWLEDWWPVAPILFGVYLVGKAILERGKVAPGRS
jgi:hypothetical protein